MEELVAECWSPLVLFLNGLVDSMDAAEDLAQESVVRLWSRRETLDPGSARAFLFRIGRNAALDQLRRRKVRSRFFSRDLGPDPSPPTPDEEFATSELQVRFQEAFAELPPRRREVFEMIRFHGLSYREVGEVLDLSSQTVANHMTHAYKDLRRLLSEYLPERQVAERAGEPGRSGHG